jgi:hypothetical protein
MAANPLKRADAPSLVVDAARAREYASSARRLGHSDVAALWEAEANRLSRQESGFIDRKSLAAGATQ